jgi:hypothetical protein
MIFTKNPVVVVPPVYELPMNYWRWCKLKEVCEVVPQVANLSDIEFAPTPEQLVSNFAALVRPNHSPVYPPQDFPNSPKKKIFRYSLCGNGMCGKEVPTCEGTPPYHHFNFNFGTAYPEEMFVPEGWVMDTLKAIRKGAAAAADFGDFKVGFCPKGNKWGRDTILLEGNSESCLVRVPKLF